MSTRGPAFFPTILPDHQTSAARCYAGGITDRVWVLGGHCGLSTLRAPAAENALAEKGQVA